MKRKKVEFFKSFVWNPRIRYGSISTAILCMMMAVLIGLNVLSLKMERKNGWRLDYSFNALTTQSETTLKILAELEHPVHIYALFPNGGEDAPLLELLDRYAAASAKITWEKADVSLNPGLITRFRGATDSQTVTNDSVIVSCEETGRFRILSPADFISLSLNYDQGVYEIAGLRYEQQITSAIDYVTRKTIPRAVLLQGHGELDSEGTAVFQNLLQNNHYEVVSASLLDGTFALDPENDLLMILSPVHDLMDAELKTITEFCTNGGALLLTCDYSDPVGKMPNWQALLRSYGFIPKDGIVVASGEEPDTYYNNTRINLIPYMASTDMTAGLVSSGSDILLLTGCRAFETPEETDRNLMVRPVLNSGYKAYLRNMETGSMSLAQQDDDEIGPFALSLQATRVTEGGHISHAMVLGCSTLLTSEQIYAMTDAEEFVITAVDYLLGGHGVNLDIMAKTAVRPQLSVRAAGIGTMALILLPIMVLVVALAVLMPRRNR